MDDSKISRRDALRLGQMGLLLGTGLGLASAAHAGQLASPRPQVPTHPGRNRFIIKFYRATGPEAEMVAWAETNYDLRKVFDQERIQAYFKFFRPTSEGKLETLGVIENVTVKYSR